MRAGGSAKEVVMIYTIVGHQSSMGKHIYKFDRMIHFCIVRVPNNKTVRGRGALRGVWSGVCGLDTSSPAVGHQSSMGKHIFKFDRMIHFCIVSRTTRPSDDEGP